MNKNCFVMMGFMGSGKSTLGKSLAQSWGWNYQDLDTTIQDKWNKSIPDIFSEEGEKSFRQKERLALLDRLGNSNKTILALGGGTPCFLDNMKEIKASASSVYIKLSAIELTRRLYRSYNPRPLIAGKTENELYEYVRKELSKREPFYQQADYIIASDNLLISDLLTFLPAPHQ